MNAKKTTMSCDDVIDGGGNRRFTFDDSPLRATGLTKRTAIHVHHSQIIESSSPVLVNCYKLSHYCGMQSCSSMHYTFIRPYYESTTRYRATGRWLLLVACPTIHRYGSNPSANYLVPGVCVSLTRTPADFLHPRTLHCFLTVLLRFFCIRIIHNDAIHGVRHFVAIQIAVSCCVASS